MFRSTDAVLFASPARIGLALVDRGRVLSFAQSPRDPGSDLVTAVEAALDLGEGYRRLWVVAGDLWSQAVMVPAEVARRVPAAELPQFVCYEIEPLSGIPPSQGAAGVATLDRTPTDFSYWVVELDRNLFEQIEGLVRSRGAKFQGILHAAAAPASLGTPAPATATGASHWRRVEIWPETVYCLASSAAGCRWSLFPRTAGGEDWRDRVQSWLAADGSEGFSETVDAARDFDSAEFAAELGFPTSIWGDDADLSAAWVAGWARALASGRCAAPLVAPPPRPMSLKTKRLFSAGAAAAVLLSCVGFYLYQGSSNKTALDDVRRRTAQALAPSRAAAEIRKAMAELEKQRADYAARDAKLEAAIQSVAKASDVHERRTAVLLATLAESCGGDVLLTHIDGDASRLIIAGRTLDPRRAMEVAEALAVKLAPLKMFVDLPAEAASRTRTEGGWYEFAFAISDAEPKEEPTSPKPPKKEEPEAPAAPAAHPVDPPQNPPAAPPEVPAAPAAEPSKNPSVVEPRR